MSKPEERTGDRPKVFISYSRMNRAMVEPLRDSLIAAGFEAYLDLHDILPGEPWQERLGKLIATADSVVFALSPDSVASKIVDWEVNEAERLSKRILPVVIRDPDPELVPGRIKRLNYIFLRNAGEWSRGLPMLADALRTDIDWIREHTRMAELAAYWEGGGRAEEHLLRGAALTVAERWLSERPREAPDTTELQRAFLQASRLGEQKRLEQETTRLAEVANAQARTGRAQRRTMAVLALMALAVIGGIWAVYAYWRNVMLNRAEFIASQADDQAQRANNPMTGMLLALEGLPDATSSRITQRLMPLEASAQNALDGAWRKHWSHWHEHRRLHGHTYHVVAVAFSPDGKLVLTGSWDNTARLWDAATSRILATLTLDTIVREVSFSTDGKLMLASIDSGTVLWEVGTGKVVATVHDHPTLIRAATFSPDGKLRFVGRAAWEAAIGQPGRGGEISAVALSPDRRLLLTGSYDHTVHLWETATGKALGTLSVALIGAADTVAFSPDGKLALAGSSRGIVLWEPSTGKSTITTLNDVRTAFHPLMAFSPDGRLMVAALQDDTVRLWEAATGKVVATLTGHTGTARAVAFSPDGKLLLTGSNDSTARLWSAATGEGIATLTGHTGPVNAVTISADGRLVLTGSEDGTAQLWEAPTSKAFFALTSVDFSPDSKVVLSCSEEGSARLWEAATGKTIATVPATKNTDVRFSPDGKLVLTRGEGDTANLWEAATGRAVATIPAPENTVLEFSPDGKLVSTRGEGDTANLWEAATGRAVATIPAPENTVLEFSPDGKLVLTRGEGDTASLWEAATGRAVATVPAIERIILKFSPDSRVLLTLSKNSTASLWEAATGNAVAVLTGHAGALTAVAFSRDSRLVLTGSEDGSARLWETATGKPLAILTSHTGKVIGVVFSPNGKLVLTQGDTVSLWEAATTKAVATIPVTSTTELEFSPDGKLLLTCEMGNVSEAGGSGGPPQLWEADTGKLQATLSGAEDFTYVAFSADGKLVATGQNDGTARLWEVGTGKAVATVSGDTTGTLKDRIREITLSRDGRWMATRAFGGAVRLWPIPSAQTLVELAKSTVSRCLTLAERQTFHLAPEAPRWCYENKLWPYDDATKFPPPPFSWDERLVGAWNRVASMSLLRQVAVKE